MNAPVCLHLYRNWIAIVYSRWDIVSTKLGQYADWLTFSFLTAFNFVRRDGVPYCEKDYQKLFGVKCAYCSRFISGKVLQVRIHRLGGNLNAKNWYAYCRILSLRYFDVSVGVICRIVRLYVLCVKCLFVFLRHGHVKNIAGNQLRGCSSWNGIEFQMRDTSCALFF